MDLATDARTVAVLVLVAPGKLLVQVESLLLSFCGSQLLESCAAARGARRPRAMARIVERMVAGCPEKLSGGMKCKMLGRRYSLA